ncbi:hypothetical protein BTVI_24244 [Pitangus sulphuratus]|nr:hypothetical protein BTVI_24244 [Pitangus sulphuratus]
MSFSNSEYQGIEQEKGGSRKPSGRNSLSCRDKTGIPDLLTEEERPKVCFTISITEDISWPTSPPSALTHSPCTLLLPLPSHSVPTGKVLSTIFSKEEQQHSFGSGTECKGKQHCEQGIREEKEAKPTLNNFSQAHQSPVIQTSDNYQICPPTSNSGLAEEWREGDILQPPDHLRGPPLNSPQQVDVLFVLGTPELDAVLQQELGHLDQKRAMAYPSHMFRVPDQQGEMKSAVVTQSRCNLLAPSGAPEDISDVLIKGASVHVLKMKTVGHDITLNLEKYELHETAIQDCKMGWETIPKCKDAIIVTSMCNDPFNKLEGSESDPED